MKDIVLLVVDVQELITDERLYKYKEFISRLKSLIASARENGTEVVYVRHDDGEGAALTKGAPGYDVFPEIKPAPGERVFDKTVNSPFKESGLLEYLNGKGVKRLIVAGLQTEYCIDATVKCGFERGFEIFVPELCNTTRDNELASAEFTYRYYNDFIWKNRYAKIVSMEEAVRLTEGTLL